MWVEKMVKEPGDLGTEEFRDYYKEQGRSQLTPALLKQSFFFIENTPSAKPGLNTTF